LITVKWVRRLLRAVRVRILGAPLIYERFRPWLLGYHDESDLFRWLACRATDIILDIGCGSGAAFKYLSEFESYHGFDVDPVVLARFRKRFPAPGIHCHLGQVQPSDLSRIQPTKVLMIGLLHHLDEERVLQVLNMLRDTSSIQRIITLDPIYVPSSLLNNLLCRFDSGHHVRLEEDLLQLVRNSGLVVKAHWHTRSGNGVAHYLQMCLLRQKDGGP
jgi:SAM-dependent methyltransferase